MFLLLRHLLQAIAPFLTPICFLFAWLLLIITIWSCSSAIAEILARARQMHQIPCTKCQYFTNDYHLKCTIWPSVANTEQAIDCSDYQAIKQ